MIKAAEAQRNVVIQLSLVANPKNKSVAGKMIKTFEEIESAAIKAAKAAADIRVKISEKELKKREQFNNELLNSINRLGEESLKETQETNKKVVGQLRKITKRMKKIWESLEDAKTDKTKKESDKREKCLENEAKASEKLKAAYKKQIESQQKATEAGLAALQGAMDLTEGLANLGLMSDENFKKFEQGFQKVEAGYKALKGFTELVWKGREAIVAMRESQEALAKTQALLAAAPVPAGIAAATAGETAVAGGVVANHIAMKRVAKEAAEETGERVATKAGSGILETIGNIAANYFGARGFGSAGSAAGQTGKGILSRIGRTTIGGALRGAGSGIVGAGRSVLRMGGSLLGRIGGMSLGGAGGPYTVEFTGTLAGTNVSIMTIDVSGLTGGVNEIQTITSPNNPTGGTFRLGYGGQWTGNIAYNASAATIETALEALGTIPTGSVACAGGALPGTDVTVTFQDNLGYADVALLEVDSSSLTGVTGTVTETTAGGSNLEDKTVNFWTFNDDSVVSGNNYYPFSDEIAAAVLRGATASYSTSASSFHVTGGIDEKCLQGGTYAYTVHDSTVGKFDEDEPFTITCWVKPSSLGSRSVLVIKHSTKNDGSSYPSTLDSNYDFALTMEPSGYIKFDVLKSGGFHTKTTTGTLTLNTWNLVTAIWDPDNTTLSIGINGGALESATGLTVGAVAASSTRYLSVLTQSVQQLPGHVDSVGIFNDAFTLSESQTIYASGAGEDYPFPSDGSNEVQTLALTGSPTSGSVNVSYQGVGVDIPYDATAAEAEALLESISTIGSGNVNVTGGDWPGTALVVEFIGTLALTNVESLQIDTSSLVMSVSETTKGVTAPTGSVETTVTPLSQSTTTPNSGPNCWDVAANWNTNTVPVNSDTPYIADSDIDILYGLDQSAVTVSELHIEQTYTGTIGLPRINTDGGTGSSYFEYRETYLKIGATELFIGEKEGDGSERIKINLGSVQSTVLITNSGESPDGNTPPILLLGTHASNVINVNRGSLGIAYYPTEVATVATLRQAFFDDATDDTTVYLGAGVTVTNITKTGGVLDINSGTTSFQQTAGTTTIHDGAHTVLSILAGLVNYNSTGTLAAANLSGDAVLVFDQDARPKDVTVINKYSDDSEIYDESGSIASPVIQLHNCGDLSTLFMGKDFKLTFSATT